MERIVKKYRQLYSKMRSLVDDWEHVRELTSSLLATCTNIIQRLPELRDSKNYDALVAIPNIQEKLLGRQLENLEGLLGSLHNKMEGMRELLDSAERIMLEGGRVLQSDGARPSPAACAACMPPAPSPAQMVEGLQDIWRCLRNDWILNAALLDSMTYDSKPAELVFIQSVFDEAPNIDRDYINDIMDCVMATAPPAR